MLWTLYNWKAKFGALNLPVGVLGANHIIWTKGKHRGYKKIFTFLNGLGEVADGH